MRTVPFIRTRRIVSKTNWNLRRAPARGTRHTTARSCTLIMNNICINHGKTLRSAHGRRPRNARVVRSARASPGIIVFAAPGTGRKSNLGKRQRSSTAATCRIPDGLRGGFPSDFAGTFAGAVGPTTSDHVRTPPPTGLRWFSASSDTSYSAQRRLLPGFSPSPRVPRFRTVSPTLRRPGSSFSGGRCPFFSPHVRTVVP